MKKINQFNKEVVIFGAGNIARALIIAMKSDPDFDFSNLVGCMVSIPNANLKDLEGIPVYSIEEIRSITKEPEVLIAVREAYYNEVEEALEKNGFYHIQRIDSSELRLYLRQLWKNNKKNKTELFEDVIDYIGEEQELLFLSKQLKESKLSFEVNVADHCNLNCQCCNHFAPISGPHYLDEERYISDLKRLLELYGLDGIGRIMLLGGEPLLNPNIESIIKETRQTVNKASIYLYTNGLLFPKMSSGFWEACAENNVGIKVTRYPLNFDYNYWMSFAKDKCIDITEENPEPIKTTYRLPMKEQGGLNKYKNYSMCYHANHCIVLREGRLYTCPISAWIDLLNKRFNKRFPSKEKNSISIYDADNKNAIDCFLKQPIDLCCYCDIEKYQYNLRWNLSRRTEEEWIEK